MIVSADFAECLQSGHGISPMDVHGLVCSMYTAAQHAHSKQHFFWKPECFSFVRDLSEDLANDYRNNAKRTKNKMSIRTEA